MKLKVESFALLDKLEGHNEIQSELIDLITKESDSTQMLTEDLLTEDRNRISYTDQNDSKDFNRKYVKIVKPYLQKYIEKCASEQGYLDPIIEDMWYQRYSYIGDKLGWHIHTGNFTGVYYLKYNNDRPTETQLIQPCDQDKRIMVVAEEGDVIVFPSYMIHKSPPLVTENEKIVISFNINWNKIHPEMNPRLYKI
jgi:hypothetical protein